MSYNPYQFQNPYQQMYGQPIPDQLQQYRQPYQMQNQPVQQPQQQSAMVWVRNRMEADAYPVAPNTAIALWDMNAPVVYKKETDVSGRPIIKAFQLVEVTDTPQQANFSGGDFVTRQEFQAFVDSLTAQSSGKFTKKEEPVNE